MNSKEKNLSILTLAIVAFVVYIFSVNDTWLGDDIFYKFNWSAKPNLEQIDSISDIFASQWTHYFTYNGRYVAHWVVQLFCGILGQNIFAICNAFMYIIYILLVIKLGNGTFKNPLVVCTASLLTLSAFDTYYAPSCQVGYIWMFVLVFTWILLFFNYKTNSLLKLSLIFLFSIIAGNSQEAITIGVSGALIIYALYNLKNLTTTQWVAFVGFGIGALLVCLSPSSISRANNLHIPFSTSLLYVFSALRIFYIFILVFFIKTISHSLNPTKFYRNNSFYINAIIILFIFNLIIGGHGNRQFFGIEALSLILTMRILKDSHFSKKILFFLFIFISFFFTQKWKIQTQSKNSYNKVYELFSASDNGNIYYNLTCPNYYPEHFHFIHAAKFILENPTGFTKSISELYQSQTGDYSKILKIYPTCIENIDDKTNIDNQVIEFDDGCYVVIQSRKFPANFTLKRTLDFFLYKKTHSDYKISWESPQFEGANYKANIIYQDVPFVSNDSIIIEHIQHN